MAYVQARDCKTQFVLKMASGPLYLAGVGTCTAEDKAVNLEDFYDVMQNTSKDSCVHHEDIKQMKVNSVLIMKGGLWPGICGRGLTHKAPATSGEKRLLIKVDLDNARYSLDFEDFSSSSEGEDEESSDDGWISDVEVGDSGELKCLTTLKGFNSRRSGNTGAHRAILLKLVGAHKGQRADSIPSTLG